MDSTVEVTKENAARQALELHRQIVALRDQAVGCAARATRLAVECGLMLTEIKSHLPHGDWELWRESYCPGISASTAQRYMRIAANRSVLTAAGLDFQTLKDVYVALGIMPAPPVSEPVKGPALPPWVKLTAKFDAIIPKLTAPQKQELRTWILAVLERL